MTWEAIRLQSWYRTRQGQTAANILRLTMEKWLAASPKVENTFGFGYPQPYLSLISTWTHHLLGASPAEMGVAPWPSIEKNRIALTRVDALPFASEHFDRVVVIHLLEGVESPNSTLREIWRIMQPGGRLLLVVPNRQGLWARWDGSPLGWGRPFSPFQLETQLQEALFCPRQYRFALFMPPFVSSRWLSAANTWEKAGMRWFAPLGGVILCEAEKVVYAMRTIHPEPERFRRYQLNVPLVENFKRLSNTFL